MFVFLSSRAVIVSVFDTRCNNEADARAGIRDWRLSTVLVVMDKDEDGDKDMMMIDDEGMRRR